MDLHFAVKDPFMTVMEETPIYDINNFIADVGGYLGLLLGASILAIFDVVADVTMSMKI